MKVITNITLRLGRGGQLEYAPPGTEVELKDKEAKELITRGFVSEVSAQDEPVEISEPRPSIDDIAEVILSLTPAEDYTKEGIPQVEAIETLLGMNITAQERDTAWAKVEVEIGNRSEEETTE